jgi:hypothetical protein
VGTAFSTSGLLAGPIPDNGAVVSYLHAETNGALSAKSSAVIEVIDHDTGVNLLACTVAVEQESCTAGVGGHAAPGDQLEVRVTATGTGANKLWKVSFRY